jgi:predicted amidohydrolase YtcJ
MTIPPTLPAALCALTLASGPVFSQTADAIYSGGDIITINDAAPNAEALAVKDGKILAVGTKEEVLKTKGGSTKMIDLGGKTLLPGFIDGHGHLSMVGIQAASANLLPAPDGEGNSIVALQKLLKDWSAKNPKGLGGSGWIVGFGYDDSQLTDQRVPNRDDLDAVSKEVPVMIIHQSGHVGSVNSKLLEVAGITAASEDPPGGVIGRRDGSKEPDGRLEELAFINVAFKLFGGFDAGTQRSLIKAGIGLYSRFGYTTAEEGRASGDNIKHEAAAAEADDLDIDVVAYPDIQMAGLSIRPPWLSREYKGRFRIGGAKLSLDGSPQAKTAWLTKPYLVPPAGQGADYVGYPAIKDDAKVNELIEKCFANNWQVLVHCNGDAAADQLIRAVRAATAKHGPGDRRTIMIHAQTVREDQLDAMKELGITPSFFAMHTFYWGDWHRDSVLGPERAARISPAASALKRGMRFNQHHDAPVALPNSIIILHSQVNRVTRTGKVLGPEQRVSVMEALKSITINAAWTHFEEDKKGSLETGKLADLVILDKNPLKIEPMELKDLRVVETIKEGRVIYSAK